MRVYVEEDDAAFREAGCKVAVGELDDIGRIESAMEQVHTVVHLAGGPSPPRGRTLEWFVEETAEVAVRAADSAGVVRFLATSELGADASSANDYLRVRGRADEIIAKSGLQYGILRCAPVIGADAPIANALRLARTARTPIAPAPGTQSLNPVAARDVAAALLVADARDAAVNGTWDVGGPDTVTYDELVARATGKGRIAHRRTVPGLPASLARAYGHDMVADTRELAAQLGFTPATTLDDMLRGLL